MAISEQQAPTLAKLTQNQPKFKQDRKIPFLINVKDARLVPNTEALRAAEGYKPYRGQLSASLAERKAYLKTERGAPTVEDLDFGLTASELDQFDVDSATKDQLARFANLKYAVELDTSKHFQTLRKEVRALMREDEAETEPLG